MTLKEKKELCSNAFISWMVVEKHDRNMAIHDKDIEELFTSKIILKKFEAFGINIVLPDMLLLILNICVNGNPGQFQLVLKDLLNDIKKRKGPIPSGYIITSMDFSFCFMTEFPIIEISHINDKYEKLWDTQKQKDLNLYDTVEWWKEVMK